METNQGSSPACRNNPMKWIPITRECPKPQTFHGPFAESREVLIWDVRTGRAAIGKAFFYGRRNHPLLESPPYYVFTGLYMDEDPHIPLLEGTHWAELEGPAETNPMKAHPKFPHSAIRNAKYALKSIAMRCREEAVNCDDQALRVLNVLHAEAYEKSLDELEKFSIQWCDGEFTETAL